MVIARLVGDGNEEPMERLTAASARTVVRTDVWQPYEAPTAVPVLVVHSDDSPQRASSPPLETFKSSAIDVSFAIGLLRRLGIEPTAWSIAFLDEWAAMEGAYQAQHNPLATTQWAEGSWCYNSVCVRHYPDQLTGLLATAKTLQLSYYPAILQSLKENRIAPGTAANLRIWGTIQLANKIERGWTNDPE